MEQSSSFDDIHHGHNKSMITIDMGSIRNIPSDTSSSNNNCVDDDAEHKHERTTELQTIVHILKGYIGPGCLSLPWCFSQLGVPLGIFVTLSLSLITTYNCLVMIKVKHEHANRRSTTYPDLGEKAYGKLFRNYVTVALCANQLAVCTVFFSFIGENVSAVVNEILRLHDEEEANANAGGEIQESSSIFSDNRVVMITIFPVIIFLSFLPNLRVLAPVTMIGSALQFVAFILVGVMVCLNWETKPAEIVAADWSMVRLTLFLSEIFFNTLSSNLTSENQLFRRLHVNGRRHLLYAL